LGEKKITEVMLFIGNSEVKKQIKDILYELNIDEKEGNV
jgi:hypothetical protein